MKLKIALTITCIGLTGCNHNDAAITALNRDVVKLTRENATLRVQLEENEKQMAAVAGSVQQVSERVRQLEVSALMKSSLSSLMAPISPLRGDQQTPEGSRRGGFTDLGSSGAALPPIPKQQQDVSSSVRPAASATTNTSWNDVANASNFYDAQRVIASKCQREWPSDPRMTQYCVEKQTQAVATLKQGRPFGADESRWNDLRVQCANKWPDDYSMRVYCEQHP